VESESGQQRTLALQKRSRRPSAYHHELVALFGGFQRQADPPNFAGGAAIVARTGVQVALTAKRTEAALADQTNEKPRWLAPFPRLHPCSAADLAGHQRAE
jgi:hypothetical protein